MTTQSNRNFAVIKEFRENGGKVGGNFANAKVLLLTTTGAKTGQPRTTPLMYLPDGDRYLVFASKGGAPENPAWYHNAKADPNVTVEAGAESFPATAAIVTGAERDRLYDKQAALYPQFVEYQKRTARKIPVVGLSRKR